MEKQRTLPEYVAATILAIRLRPWPTKKRGSMGGQGPNEPADGTSENKEREDLVNETHTAAKHVCQEKRNGSVWIGRRSRSNSRNTSEQLDSPVLGIGLNTFPGILGSAIACLALCVCR